MPPTPIVRLPTGARLELYGDPIGDALIQNVPLRDHQRAAIEEAGCALVEAAPPGPHVSFPDDLYLTGDLLRAFVEGALRAPDRPAILALPRTRELDDQAITQDVTVTDA